MDQNTIKDALKRALEQGTGSLDDLNALMDRVKADIEKAKQEEEAAAARKAEAEKAQKEAEFKKRGDEIAMMATRVLDGETTSADVALVMNSYLKAHGMDAEVTAEGIEEGFKHSQELNTALDELADSFKELVDMFGMFDNNKEKVDKHINKKETPDDVIARFLRSHGL